MKKLTLSILVVLSVFVLAGCAWSSSIKNQPNKILSQKLVKGRTTESQVSAMLGQPTSKTFKGNGDPEWLYRHNGVRPVFSSFIPIIMFFAIRQNGTDEILTIIFHKNKTVKDWTLFVKKTSHLVWTLLNMAPATPPAQWEKKIR